MLRAMLQQITEAF